MHNPADRILNRQTAPPVPESSSSAEPIQKLDGDFYQHRLKLSNEHSQDQFGMIRCAECSDDRPSNDTKP